MDRLKAGIRAKGMTVFAHIDHAAGATAAGLPLRPTELLIFGQCQARHAADAGQPGDRHRSAIESAGVQDAAHKVRLS